MYNVYILNLPIICDNNYCIILLGLWTEDPHSQKEHDSKLSKILKFGVNQVNIEQDRAIQDP